MPVTIEDKLDYVLAVLATMAEVKANYHELAQATGMKNANKAQIKFKKIVDGSGTFKLVNGRVVSNSAGANSAGETPQTPTTTSASKRRGSKKDVGIEKTVDEEADDNHDGNETPTPRKMRKVKHKQE